MDFVISILLKLALTVVKDVFCDGKKLYGSFKRHIKANPKTKIMNAYFQHLLYYRSERKDLKH